MFDGDAIERLRPMFKKVVQAPEVAQGIIQPALRAERVDIAKRYCLQGALWSQSYFAVSCGGASISVVRQYIEQQATPT